MYQTASKASHEVRAGLGPGRGRRRRPRARSSSRQRAGEVIEGDELLQVGGAPAQSASRSPALRRAGPRSAPLAEPALGTNSTEATAAPNASTVRGEAASAASASGSAGARAPAHRRGTSSEPARHRARRDVAMKRGRSIRPRVRRTPQSEPSPCQLQAEQAGAERGVPASTSARRRCDSRIASRRARRSDALPAADRQQPGQRAAWLAASPDERTRATSRPAAARSLPGLEQRQLSRRLGQVAPQTCVRTCGGCPRRRSAAMSARRAFHSAASSADAAQVAALDERAARPATSTARVGRRLGREQPKRARGRLRRMQRRSGASAAAPAAATIRRQVGRRSRPSGCCPRRDARPSDADRSQTVPAARSTALGARSASARVHSGMASLSRPGARSADGSQSGADRRYASYGRDAGLRRPVSLTASA